MIEIPNSLRMKIWELNRYEGKVWQKEKKRPLDASDKITFLKFEKIWKNIHLKPDVRHLKKKNWQEYLDFDCTLQDQFLIINQGIRNAQYY